ncbi:MAG: hypothetical protein ACRC28_09810, partial [Clostridium sp.]|uniref:hypothetical protein n=1 Tax=Clostridium sp. TaxID=1506 RepID=UPI003F40AD12
MRIIGYKDIRDLNKLKEWEELKKVPHFCISKALSNGVLRYYEKESLGLVTTIDKLIKIFFEEWVNSEKEVKRLVKISEFIKDIRDEKIRNSFKKSKSAIYNTVKTCIECNVRLEDIEECEKEEEQHFFEIYRKAMEEEAFDISILDKKGIGTFNATINRILDEKIERGEFEGSEEIKENYKYIERVILHGIHKFTPLILKLIQTLEENEIQVIFLINYNDDFKNMYKTWKEVYGWTNLEIENESIKDTREHSVLAENYKNIIEGNLEKIDVKKRIDVLEFEDYAELSNYICEKKDSGEKEQYYAADTRKINDILKNYYIEDYKERHFLAFTEGQFLLNLFNMVDEDNNIKIEIDVLEEALMTGFLEVDISVFDRIKVYLKDLNKKDISEYIKRMDSLLSKIKIINRKEENIKEEYKRISYYSVTTEEVNKIKKVFESIKDILEKVKSDEENVLKKYKDILIEADEKRNNQEKSKIKEVYSRIEKISLKEKTKEYKELLYYIIKRDDEKKEEGAIVRDFNHIEGGILEEKKTYHFMDISDGSMQKEEKKVVWPLDIEFLRRKNKNLDIIKNSLDEGKNYLRYSLFYGLYFTENNIKISYIKNKEKKDDLYFILKFMNIN